MSMEQQHHLPVMLSQVIDGLCVKREGNYVDATFGRGGHSSELLGRLTDEGRLIVIDRDPQAIAEAQRRYGTDSRVSIAQARFSQLDQVLQQHNMPQADGIMMDIGLSSPQLDQADRGFSFMQDGPLDMRMDAANGPTAAEWLTEAPVQDIIKVLREYGEERQARRIASAIVAEREHQPLERTAQLAELVEQTIGRNPRKASKHPATRTFQAIRIHINDELNELQTGLHHALQALAVGGRLAVISFHSLEDRMVKRLFNQLARPAQGNRRLPELPDATPPQFRLCGKIQPDSAEVSTNPRSRSAVLRIIERCSEQQVTT